MGLSSIELTDFPKIIYPSVQWLILVVARPLSPQLYSLVWLQCNCHHQNPIIGTHGTDSPFVYHQHATEDEKGPVSAVYVYVNGSAPAMDHNGPLLPKREARTPRPGLAGINLEMASAKAESPNAFCSFGLRITYYQLYLSLSRAGMCNVAGNATLLSRLSITLSKLEIDGVAVLFLRDLMNFGTFPRMFSVFIREA